jgi:hypothetical protein
MNMDKKNNGTRLIPLVTIKNNDTSKWALRLQKKAFAPERQLKNRLEQKWTETQILKIVYHLVLRKSSANRRHKEQ